MNQLQKLRLVADLQQEIINAQRLYIAELNKKLPEDDRTRWNYFFNLHMKNLDEIHNENFNVKKDYKVG